MKSFKDRAKPFKIDEKDLLKRKYMIFMVHAMGVIWASEASYGFSTRMCSFGQNHIFKVWKWESAGHGYVVSWTKADIMDEPTLAMESITLSELELLYKKELSLFGIPEYDKTLVDGAQEEYYESLTKGV